MNINKNRNTHRCALLVLCICFQMVCYSANAQNKADCWLEDKNTGKRFIIFNALLYEQLQDLKKYCIEPINVMYAWEFFPRGPKKNDFRMPEPTAIEKAIKKIKTKNEVTVIDIEHWPLAKVSSKVYLKSINNYLVTMNVLKNSLPNVPIGYYGVAPVIDFSRAKNIGSRGYGEWVKENSRMMDVAQSVDAFFPSLYTINSDQRSWLARAKASIDEAHRLGNGKPVYPFIWPNFHEQGGKYPPGTEVPADYWRTQLNFLRENADGFVLWGGYKQTFNSEMMWWKELMSFIEDSFVVKENIGTSDR